MASIASGEALLLLFFFDGVYYALSRGVLKRNFKLTSNHYFVAESLFCVQWNVALQDVILNKKKWGINIYDQLINFMLKSTSMNLSNVLVRFNKLLQYCCSFPHIQYRGHNSPLHLPSQKKKKRVWKHFFFPFHLRCCKN